MVSIQMPPSMRYASTVSTILRCYSASRLYNYEYSRAIILLVQEATFFVVLFLAFAEVSLPPSCVLDTV